MQLTLNYIGPDKTVHTKAANPPRVSSELYANWLNAMVDRNPEMNFFYTVESTDIFEEEAGVYGNLELPGFPESDPKHRAPGEALWGDEKQTPFNDGQDPDE